MPVDCGSITPSSAHAATAASAAVPPAFSTSMAATPACGCEVATMPFWAWTVERPARWKFLIRAHFGRCLAAIFAEMRAFMTHSCRLPQCLACQRMGAMLPLHGGCPGQLRGACLPAKPAAMTYKVAAFYQFTALADFPALREPLRAR